MKRSPVKPMSDKRRAENQERAKTKTIVVQRSGGKCEARALIASVDPVAASACRGTGSEMHEKLKRSRGGSIIDPANIVFCCRSCHSWTEDQPRLATEVGLLISQWAT